MGDTSETWERALIDKFFHEKVPLALGSEAGSASVCTEDSCIQFAKTVFKADDLAEVDNQGCTSFTLLSLAQGIVIQFRLNPLPTDIICLANQIYGDQVPMPNFHDGFPLPVYSCKIIPGRVHSLQSFPDGNFPLQREKTTVAELGQFVARAASFKQPKPYAETSRTKSAEATFRRLINNASLKDIAPEISELVSKLQNELHLLEILPAVVTHHDLGSYNILVDDFGHVTGVIDFDSAEVEAFGMCIWGLYECFFGCMEGGKWFFHDMLADSDDASAGTVHQVLEQTFWEAFWTHVSSDLKTEEVKRAVKISLSVGVINRYFNEAMMDELDMSQKHHERSLEYARGILPSIWKDQLPEEMETV